MDAVEIFLAHGGEYVDGVWVGSTGSAQEIADARKLADAGAPRKPRR
jgi:hypothetical protein